MIRLEITKGDQISNMGPRNKLRKYGFTQFTGRFDTEEDLMMDSVIFYIYPSRQDILTMQFKTDYKYPWQKRKEILFQKFK